MHHVTNESVGRVMSVLEQGADGNDISMTNVPDIRLRYRHEVSQTSQSDLGEAVYSTQNLKPEIPTVRPKKPPCFFLCLPPEYIVDNNAVVQLRTPSSAVPSDLTSQHGTAVFADPAGCGVEIGARCEKNACKDGCRTTKPTTRYELFYSTVPA